MWRSTGLRRKIDIAVIAPSAPEELFDLLWLGIDNAEKELASFGVAVLAFKTIAHDSEAQLRLLTNLLGSHFAAIVLVPAHTERLNGIIALHAQEDRPVVTFHSDAPDSQRCSYVGTSAQAAGALAAECLVKFMGGVGKIASFPGDLSFLQFSERHAGFQRELARSSNLATEVFCEAGLTDMPGKLARALDQHPDLGGIYVGSARTFLVAAAMERNGLRVPFVGFDNTAAVRPFLQNGIVSAVIDESVHQQGYIAVQRAYEVCVSKIKTHKWVRVPSSLVLASNSAEAQVGETLNEAFEQLIRQQTAQLQTYKEQLDAANRKLIKLAETDGLTGLLNRRKFEEVLSAELDAPHSSICLLLVDIDDFKKMNDTLGHHTGDDALRRVAAVLQNCTRERDYCARLGGDEFCVLLSNTNRAEAERVRSRITQDLAGDGISHGAVAGPVQASIGVAEFGQDADTLEDLMIAADRSMYQAKRSAKSRVRMISEDAVMI